MKRKEAIKEVIALRADLSDGLIDRIEFKECVSRVAELSGISYEELLSETAE